MDSTRIGVWMNSRISSIGKDLLKRVVTDERSHGPLGMTLGLSLNDTFWVQDGSHTWEEVNLYENPLNPEIAELAFTQGLSPQKVLGSRSPELRVATFCLLFVSVGHLRTFRPDSLQLRPISSRKGLIKDSLNF